MDVCFGIIKELNFLDSPFTLTIVTTSPVLWSSPVLVMMYFENILLLCSRSASSLCKSVWSIQYCYSEQSPSNDIDRNIKVSFCFFFIRIAQCCPSSINRSSSIFQSEIVIYKKITLQIYETGSVLMHLA